MQTLSLKPQVKGKLKKFEKVCIGAVKSGDKVRTTIAVDAPIALAAVRAADRETRDFSAFCAQVMRDYEARNPAPTAEKQELFAKLELVIANRPEIQAQLEKIARDGNRTKRRERAA